VASVQLHEDPVGGVLVVPARIGCEDRIGSGIPEPDAEIDRVIVEQDARHRGH
jgi:hypothetical protein